jgi:microcystin-dependent protein
MINLLASFTNTNGSAFPDTEAINVSAPGAGDGTEFVALMVNNVWGFQQALMDYAGLTPDGVQEAPGTAQFLDALAKGYGIGPGVGVIYWKNDTPAAKGDRVLLLQGQVITIANYAELVAETYIGDGNNADTDYTGFYKTSDAGGTTRNTAGAYFVLPDTRGLSLKNIGDAVINTRTKTGPAKLTELQEDQMQGHDFYLFEDNVGNTGISINPDRTVDRARSDGADSDYSLSGTNTNAATLGKTNGGITDDGVNGTPRTGDATRDSVIGTNFGITY